MRAAVSSDDEISGANSAHLAGARRPLLGDPHGGTANCARIEMSYIGD